MSASFKTYVHKHQTNNIHSILYSQKQWKTFSQKRNLQNWFIAIVRRFFRVQWWKNHSRKLQFSKVSRLRRTNCPRCSSIQWWTKSIIRIHRPTQRFFYYRFYTTKTFRKQLENLSTLYLFTAGDWYVSIVFLFFRAIIFSINTL